MSQDKSEISINLNGSEVKYQSESAQKLLEKPAQILKKYFGYDSFREGQERLVQSILSGSDTFGVMPTGAGKSICYQVPALAMEGVTIVVSPLISLMKDQVSALNEAGIYAAYINSSLSERQVRLALQYAAEGRYQLIYVAPERLETEEFLNFALHTKIAMITVDEAHCISQWGQDFRPSYMKIVRFIEKLPQRPVVSAFTATATKEVMEDIICVLRLQNPIVVVTGYDRKNLYFEVRAPKDKDTEVLDYITKHPDYGGIIYCATRKNVDELQELLIKNKITAAKYHAGMSETDRSVNQEDFIYDRKLVMVATNAFGMGIDKSNVRYVIHYNMPKNMEAYYQEAGRAGRDGAAAECILLYGGKDVRINQFLIENGNENDDLSDTQRELIRERDEERLKIMTYYCFTKDCLREYILRYFGQFGESCCDNCSNCLTEFEERDVTDHCKDIIGCVRESGGRYGINVIIATLLGRKAAKLTANNMINSKYYGRRASDRETYLKHIINKLIIDNYLYLTNDKYSIVKINKSAASIAEGNARIIMKLSKENVIQQNSVTDKKKRKSELLTSKGMDLFDHLRQLRTSLAKEEGMPPYIIFSDKTLTDMCIKLPSDRGAMLKVNGVGENKYEKYGQRFIEEIQRFTQGQKEKLYYEQEEDNLGQTPQTRKLKTEFYLTDEMKQGTKPEGTIMISEFVDRLNLLRDESRMKRLAATHLTSKLREEGYLIDKYNPTLGRNVSTVTQKGLEIGISVSKRISEKGNEYEVLLYNEKAQDILLSMVCPD
jgi:ATP-dependent DNA helicase RecQ